MIGEPRLINRNLTCLQRGNAARVVVDAGDAMAEIGEANTGNEADIASADHAHAHTKGFLGPIQTAPSVTSIG